MLKAIQQQQEDLTECMEQPMHINLVEALAQYGHAESKNKENYQQPTTNSDPQVNLVCNATSNGIAIHRALEALTTRLEMLSTNTTPLQRCTGDTDPLPTINPCTGCPYKRYCWTHGCCAHWGCHCNAKKG